MLKKFVGNTSACGSLLSSSFSSSFSSAGTIIPEKIEFISD
jgi:hypothetical protein